MPFPAFFLPILVKKWNILHTFATEKPQQNRSNMATIKLYLDKRNGGDGGAVKIMISHRSSSTTHATGLKIPAKCWDSRAQRVVRHPQAAAFNIRLSSILNRWELALMELRESGAGRSH